MIPRNILACDGDGGGGGGGGGCNCGDDCNRSVRRPYKHSELQLGQRCARQTLAIVIALIAFNCCLSVSSFQLVNMKQQQPQHISNPQAGHQMERHQTLGATSTALAVRHQHKRHNLGQELGVQQQQSMRDAHQQVAMTTPDSAATASAKSAKSNQNRLVSKLKDARHRRRNRHHHRHRHYQKMSANVGTPMGHQFDRQVQQQQQQPQQVVMKYAKPSAAATAAFAAMTAMAAEPTVQSASSTALTALESIVEEVARAGVQQLVGAGGSNQQSPLNSNPAQMSAVPSSASNSAATAASSSSASSSVVGVQQQQQSSALNSVANLNPSNTNNVQQQLQQSAANISPNGNSPSISASEILLVNGSMSPLSSMQSSQSAATAAISQSHNSNSQPAPGPVQLSVQQPQPQMSQQQQQQQPQNVPTTTSNNNHHLTRGPLHSTRSFLLTSTLSKIYNLLNVTEFALEMRDGISSRASCVACNAVVGLFLSPLYSKEVFSAAIRTVCISFRIQSARVCTGLVESFQDDFEYIRKNTKLTRDEICGVVFGVDCARRQTYNLFWTVPIPDMPANLAATANVVRPHPNNNPNEASTLAPIPMDEHSLTSMEDAPDLFEYRKSSLAAASSQTPTLMMSAKELPHQQQQVKQKVSPMIGTGLLEPKQSEIQKLATDDSHPDQMTEKNNSNGNKLSTALKRPQYIFDENETGDANRHSINGADSHTFDQQRQMRPLSTFVHLTDIHIDPYYEAGSLNECNEPLCCRATSGPISLDRRRQAGRWGDYGNCDVPVRTLRNALERIREKHSNAEYWLWTGDISPHDIWNISKSEAANHVRLVTKLVRDYSNGLPVFPVIGNHEAHPVNSFAPPEIKGKFSMSWLYDLLADEWSEWLPEEAIRTLRIGGYYKLQVRKGLRILAMNTNYCARLNPWSFFDPVDPAGQLKWLVDELLDAELNQDKVHIIGHVPPDNRECTQSWLFNFINIVDRFRDTILAQFYGHTHRDEWRVIYSLARPDEPIGMQFIGPSITPFTENNPSYRIYHQDKQGYIHDSETYYFNLTEANETPTSEPRWRFSYSNRRDLNMTQGLNSQVFHHYLQRLHEDDDAFDIFFKNFYRFSDVKVGQVCKNKCKQQLLSDLRLSHPYKTKPKPFLSNRKTSNHHHNREHHHHHHKRLRHHQD